MKLLEAVKDEMRHEYRFRVHLDESKLVGQKPDPEWVKEFCWGMESGPVNALPLAPRWTETTYLAAIRREMAALARAELDARRRAEAPVVHLPGEGASL